MASLTKPGNPPGAQLFLFTPFSLTPQQSPRVKDKNVVRCQAPPSTQGQAGELVPRIPLLRTLHTPRHPFCSSPFHHTNFTSKDTETQRHVRT